MGIKLEYGIRDGKRIHISEIDPSQNGAKCNCFCPRCNTPLIAKALGKKRTHHFAHMDDSNCADSYSPQTPLHLLAKKIIQQNSSILLPGWSIERNDIISRETPLTSKIQTPSRHINAKIYNYSDVRIEKQIKDIVPDAVIKIANKPLIVEIAVAHFVDITKQKRIVALQLPAIEIDLSNIPTGSQNNNDILQAVLYDESNRKWIYLPKREKLLAQYIKEFREFRNSLFTEKNCLPKSPKATPIPISIAHECFRDNEYRKVLSHQRKDFLAEKKLKEFSFATGLVNYPFYMDIPISDEIVFSCDRRIWQATLFGDYVYDNTEKCPFRISNIQKTLWQDPRFIQLDRDKAHRFAVYLFNMSYKKNWSFEEVTEVFQEFSFHTIKKYFNYLCLLGFVSFSPEDPDLVIPELALSINSPKKDIAEKLEKIIKKCDSNDPNIDTYIEKLMQS